MSQTRPTGRFRDDGRRLEDFTGLVLVVCPRCGQAAEVRSSPDHEARGDRSGSRRLTCAHCSLSRTSDQGTVVHAQDRDPFFGLPLVLSATCAGHSVSAYNVDHLDHLLAYVEATVRERSAPSAPNDGQPTSMVEKLPAWFAAAGNRKAIASALRRLRAEHD